jgi:hypothetical protein
MATRELPSPQIASAIADPGLILRASISLGEQDCVVQYEGYLDRDCSQREVDALTDKMILAGKRQKAKHQLPGLRRQLEDARHTLGENKVRLEKLNASEKAAFDERKNQAQRLTAQAQALVTAEQDGWIASGRKGDFRLQGSAKSRVDRMNAEIEALSSNQNKESSEAQIQRGQLVGEIEAGDRKVYMLGVLIEENERAAHGEDISEVREG